MRNEEGNEREAFYVHSLVDFYGRKLNEKCRTILDIPCGHGRLHKYLRGYGYEVYGVDISTELIEIARSNHKDFEDHYFIGDMRNFRLGREVDVVLNWFTSFGYFDDEGNMEVLKNFRENLRDGGLLIIDFPNFHLHFIDNKAIVYDYGDIIGIVREYLDDGSRYSVCLINSRIRDSQSQPLRGDYEASIK
ncbi:MAG: class I SAM-dependent methyltransferase [Vulcanisaeta sp.]|uniref:class I SAM-dependent methyltransferase n=1 Tax=Vulcanisaeta sp. TaxID=2020871 RepID=UPI003D10804A